MGSAAHTPNSGFACYIAGSRATNTPRQTRHPPKRSPIQPKPSLLGSCRPMGLHFGGHTPSSRGLAPPLGGNCTTRGPDTPTTRRKKASCRAKPPPPPSWSAPAGPEGPAPVPMSSKSPATGPKGGPLPVQNSPRSPVPTACPVQNSPSTPAPTACAVQNSPRSPEMP